MAQMTKEELYNYLIGKGMVQAGRNPGTLSVDLGDNTGYITQFTTPPGFRESQVADVANPAGFNTPYQTPADWIASIDNMTYVPDWQQALKEADNGGFLADYGWMLPLAIAAGGPMIGGLGAAGTGGAISSAEAAAAMGGGVDAAGWGGMVEGAGGLDLMAGAQAGGMLSGTQAPILEGLEIGGEGVGAAGASAADASMMVPSLPYDVGSVLDAATTAAAAGAGGAASLIPGFTNAQLVSGGLSLVGGLLSGNAATGAARTSADAQLEAARIAADAAKFRPVGVSTRFGQSQFQKDAQGNVIGAGYTLSPDVKAQQDRLMRAASGGGSPMQSTMMTGSPQSSGNSAMSQQLASDLAYWTTGAGSSLPVAQRRISEIQGQIANFASGNTLAGNPQAPQAQQGQQAQQSGNMLGGGDFLSQFENSMRTTAPMGQAAQSMFNLGQGYLNTSPQAQAAKYLADQQALLAAGRERDLSKLETRLLSQGRLGLATGGTSTGMMAANPEMEALRNAQMQQDLGLAAAATQGGMDYAKFGAGMVGSGGQMLRDMYGTQQAAYGPYQTAMQGSQYLEGLGQNALTLGMDIGRTTSAASGNAGNLLAQGMTNAANTMQPSNAYSPWGSMLTGAGNTIANMSAQQNPTYDPSKFRLVPFGT